MTYLPNIALSGRSGVGKTTMAEYLCSRHGYQTCSTGAICREVCRLVFQTEAKHVLNKVTDALKTIDEAVWLKNALRRCANGKPIVFDSMRFLSDFTYLRSEGFLTWRLDAPLEVCVERLRRRGQEFRVGIDDLHRCETELSSTPHDVVLDASMAADDLFGIAARILATARDRA